MEGASEPVPCLAAIVLFGGSTARFLPQSGVDAVAYPGVEKDYAAVIHRDYLLAHTDVELGLYPDWLEIVSPGRLPNGVTVERMLAGTALAGRRLMSEDGDPRPAAAPR